jgi:hypothetical protein
MNMKLLAALSLAVLANLAGAQPHYWHHHSSSWYRHHHYRWQHNQWVGLNVYVGPSHHHHWH